MKKETGGKSQPPLGGRGGPRAAQADDRGHHDDRPAAGDVRHRDRHPGDEAHRRADGRRADLVDGADAGDHPGDLSALAAVAASQRLNELVARCRAHSPPAQRGQGGLA